MAKPLDPNRSYQAPSSRKDEEYRPRHAPAYPSEATKEALGDLEIIASWVQLAHVCAEQKRRRGW